MTVPLKLSRGLFARVFLSKNIDVNLEIRKNRHTEESQKIDRNTIGRRNIHISIKEMVGVDSAEFEDIFTVYSSNSIIAMQLLTADMIQLLIDFKKQNNILPELTLKKNALYIRFHTGNMFEAPLLKNSLDYDIIKKYYDTLDFIVKLTEKFTENINKTEL